MAEIWGAAVAAAGAIYSTSESKKAASEGVAQNREMARVQAGLDALDAEYQDQWNEYQANRAALRKDRGLAEFRKFSSVSDFAPNYQQDYEREVVEAPSIADYMTKVKAIDDLAKNPPKKKKKGLFGKLDFLGIDPIADSMDNLLGTDANSANAAAQAGYTAAQQNALNILG